MATCPDQLKYTREHEWLKLDGKTAVVGITDHAAELLGDVVHVELPKVGDEFGKGDSMGVVESVKSVSDIYAPVACKVIEINDVLADNAGVMNEDAFGEGWYCKIEVTNNSDLTSLLNASDYMAFLSEES